VTIAPGKTAHVEIPLTDETFNWWDETTQNVNPVHGKYELLYGGSSADDALKVLEYEY
jgi:beta-glucosidase